MPEAWAKFTAPTIRGEIARSQLRYFPRVSLLILPCGSDWSANAVGFRGQNGTQHVYVCPGDGSIGSIWGTDVYTDDSSVCTAAVHAGLITLSGGGTVTIEIRPGQDSYQGSTRYGITSSSYGSWGGSYVFVT